MKYLAPPTKPHSSASIASPLDGGKRKKKTSPSNVCHQRKKTLFEHLALLRLLVSEKQGMVGCEVPDISWDMKLLNSETVLPIMSCFSGSPLETAVKGEQGSATTVFFFYSGAHFILLLSGTQGVAMGVADLSLVG